MRQAGSILLLFCAGFSVLWGLGIGRSVPGGVLDFQAVYYGTRCLLNHSDPYNESEFTRQYLLEGRELPPTSAQRRAVTLYVNLPTTLLFLAPFALLPWGAAHALWIALLAAGFVFAAFLMWRLGTASAPGVSLTLVCILLLNSEVLFATGDTAGVVVSLIVIAVWCFLNEQYVPIGTACLALALAVKPHDAGILWFYFLLAGRPYRKRALQSLGITSVLAIAAVLWVTIIAPHWLTGLFSNLSASSTHGGLHEPGLTSMTGRTPAMVIDLQAVTSAIWSDPHIYNLVSYLICGVLIAVWAFTTLRSRFSIENAWIAVACAAPLTMLVTYHRPYDAKLLLLTIPACCMLWAEGGLIGWLALILTTAGILFAGDIFLATIAHFAGRVDLSAASPAHRMISGILLQPVPLILLAMTAFYLAVYVRRAGTQSGAVQSDGLETPATSPSLQQKG